jgi:hypothetical protein
MQQEDTCDLRSSDRFGNRRLLMSHFDQLVASRREWIAEVLIPWCRQAKRADLRRAELEWVDIAGKADLQATLWTWAWERFPVLVSQGIRGIDETWLVVVTLADGRKVEGYPDSRESQQGQLVLVNTDGTEGAVTRGPFSIDEIVEVVRRD